MNAAQRIKEALSIAGMFIGGYAVILVITYVVALMADKAFGNHLLPRIFVVAAILTVLGWLLFRKRGRAGRP
jgi:cytochrome c biogenesis protein CcdA